MAEGDVRKRDAKEVIEELKRYTPVAANEGYRFKLDESTKEDLAQQAMAKRFQRERFIQAQKEVIESDKIWYAILSFLPIKVQ